MFLIFLIVVSIFVFNVGKNETSAGVKSGEWGGERKD
jgi:hypothetical protein